MEESINMGAQFSVADFAKYSMSVYTGKMPRTVELENYFQKGRLLGNVYNIQSSIFIVLRCIIFLTGTAMSVTIKTTMAA